MCLYKNIKGSFKDEYNTLKKSKEIISYNDRSTSNTFNICSINTYGSSNHSCDIVDSS